MKNAIPLLLIVFFIWFGVHNLPDDGKPTPVPDPVVVDPKPEPPKPEPPKPEPTPEPLLPADGLRVLIVDESEARTSAQAAIIQAAAWQEYVEGKGGQWRAYDQHTPIDGDAPEWKAGMQRERASLPWLIISGKSNYEGPLPDSAAALFELIRKHAG